MAGRSLRCTQIMSEIVVIGWQKPPTHVSSERGGDRRRHDERDGMSPSLRRNGRESTRREAYPPRRVEMAGSHVSR